jgi:hypothetical protein
MKPPSVPLAAEYQRRFQRRQWGCLLHTQPQLRLSDGGGLAVPNWTALTGNSPAKGTFTSAGINVLAFSKRFYPTLPVPEPHESAVV